MAFRMPLTKTSVIGAFTSYCIVIFLISLADGVMSYTAPVFIENNLNNAGKMGLIIAASSFSGLVFDFLIGELFSKKSYRFYLLGAIILAFLFPLIFLTLPSKAVFFIFGMVAWGIYYELIRFSDFHFIHAYVEKDKHAKSWGTLLIFKSLAYTLGPLIASLLISKYFNLSFISALSFVLLALLLFLAFSRTYKKKEQGFGESPKKVSMINNHQLTQVVCCNSLLRKPHRMREKLHLRSYEGSLKQGIIKELKIWKILFRKIWPLWIFIFAIFMLDATFWTAGAVLSETLKQKSAFGGFLLTVYMVPGLFMGLLAQKASKPLGKKKIAFISGLLNGLILILVGFTQNIPIILILVFFSSILGALSVPEILATFEDYVSRLPGFGNDMISLERTGENASYILGPIIAGFLAQILGFQKVFSVMGLLLAVTAIVALIFTPRKIPMPQKDLSTLT